MNIKVRFLRKPNIPNGAVGIDSYIPTSSKKISHTGGILLQKAKHRYIRFGTGQMKPIM